MRVRNGEVLATDGPFAETKEQLAGYYVVECKDLDEAIEVAAKIPGARTGSIEVRPIWETVSPEIEAAVAEAFQSEWGRVVATLVRLTGDWDMAEECAQDAFATALERWPRDGVPRRPGAWLTTVARNRAVDRARRATLGVSKMREVAGVEQGERGARRCGWTDPRKRRFPTTACA